MGTWVNVGSVLPDEYSPAARGDNREKIIRNSYKKEPRFTIPIYSFVDLNFVLNQLEPDLGQQLNGKMQRDELAIPIEFLRNLNYSDSIDIMSLGDLTRRLLQDSRYSNYWMRIPSADKAMTREVYHYTSSRGAIGILSEKTFRASSIRFMNDSQEFALGKRIVSSLIKEIDLHQNVGVDQKKFIHETLKAVEGRFGAEQLFVLCASNRSDSLSQWRGYGRDHTGDAAGYSIGIHGGSYGFIQNDGILVATSSLLPYRRWQSVLYIHYEQENLLTQALGFCASLVPSVPNWRSFKKTLSYTKILNLASAVLMDCIASCKDINFNSEEEVRMIFSVSTGNDLISHREGASGIVPNINIRLTTTNPYLDMLENMRNTGTTRLAIKPLPIDQIIVGPSAKSRLAESGLESLAKSTGHLGVKINRSKIPFQ